MASLNPACWVGPEMAKCKEEWTVNLTEDDIVEIEAAVSKVEKNDAKMEHITRADFALPKLGPKLQDVAKEVEKGRGFMLVRGLPVMRWSEKRSKLALWGMGAHMGTAEKQDAAGLMLHDVRDIAPKADNESIEQRMAKDNTIRGFQTNAALPYHTDGCDAFVLLCVRKGDTGGQSLLISALSVFNEIKKKRPDLAKVLQENFHFDARGQRRDGAKCQVCPIYTEHKGRTFVMHKEPYIHSAQRFEDVPRLTPAQKEALDYMRQVMDSDDLALKFTLEPGEFIIASNHSTMHGRTAFDVATGSEERSVRHMLRLWVTLDGGEATDLPPHYRDTREYCDSYARRAMNGFRSMSHGVMDGSMGRLLLNEGLPSDGVLWSAKALAEEQYNAMVVDAHAQYIRAGAHSVTTNSYAVQPNYYKTAFGDDWRTKLKEHTKLAAELACKARDECGRQEVIVLGCMPPLVDSHRPDLTEDGYLRDGQDFYEGVYRDIVEALGDNVDALVAETHSTVQEMMCAVRASAAFKKPIIVSMAAALLNRSLVSEPSKAATVAEFVLQEVEQGRADIPMLCFNCGTPEACTTAIAAIPDGLRRRLRRAGVSLGVFPNLNRSAEKRQKAGFDRSKQKADGKRVTKIARVEGMNDDVVRYFCHQWAELGCTHIGGCCGSTPVDIKCIADYQSDHGTAHGEEGA